MQTDILKYIEGCDKCQRANTHRKKASNPLNPNKILTRPWQIISINIIGELPESQGFNAIFVIVNRFSKQIHVILINTSLSSEGYTQIFQPSSNSTEYQRRLSVIKGPKMSPIPVPNTRG